MKRYGTGSGSDRAPVGRSPHWRPVATAPGTVTIALGARQIFSFIVQFSIFHIPFVIYHCRSRLWRATVYDKQNIENETTKAPPSVVHLSPCATRQFARPAILSGNDDLLDSEIFP